MKNAVLTVVAFSIVALALLAGDIAHGIYDRGREEAWQQGFALGMRAPCQRPLPIIPQEYVPGST